MFQTAVPHTGGQSRRRHDLRGLRVRSGVGSGEDVNVLTGLRILPVTGRVIIFCRSPRRRHGPRTAGGANRRWATDMPRAVAGGTPLRVPRPLHSPAPLSEAARLHFPCRSAADALPAGARARARGGVPCAACRRPRAATVTCAFVGGGGCCFRFLPCLSCGPTVRKARARPPLRLFGGPLPVPAPSPVAWGDSRGGAVRSGLYKTAAAAGLATADPRSAVSNSSRVRIPPSRRDRPHSVARGSRRPSSLLSRSSVPSSLSSCRAGFSVSQKLWGY